MYPLPVCVTCGHASFPPRVVCPYCGGREWNVADAAGGVLEELTEHAGVRIGSVRTELGVVLVARVANDPAVDAWVLLDADDGVPVARPSNV